MSLISFIFVATLSVCLASQFRNIWWFYSRELKQLGFPLRFIRSKQWLLLLLCRVWWWVTFLIDHGVTASQAEWLSTSRQIDFDYIYFVWPLKLRQPYLALEVVACFSLNFSMYFAPGPRVTFDSKGLTKLQFYDLHPILHVNEAEALAFPGV